MKHVYFWSFLFILMGIFSRNNIVYAESLVATPTTISYVVNDEYLYLRSYSIGESNYVNLRDVAQVFSSTSKKFDIQWNGKTNTITIHQGKAYQPAGDEGFGDLMPTLAYHVNNHIEIKNGSNKKVVSMDSYTIDGYTYYKLRDIASHLNFQIYWTENNELPIRIETERPYDESSSYYIGKYVFLKSVNGSKKRLAFDEIEWIRSENKKRMKELNLTEKDMTNGYAIYNPEQKLEVYPIDDNCIFYYIYMDGYNGMVGARSKLSGFPKRDNYDVCMIGITNGKVTWVHQVHRP